MNLTDLTKPVDSRALAKLIKTQFGDNFNIASLKLKESITLLNKTNSMIVEFKKNGDIHQSENNAPYMKMLMLREAVEKRVNELTAKTQIKESEMNNKLLSKALKIAALGGTLSEDQLNAMRITESMKAVLRNKNTARSFMRKIVESKKLAKASLLESEIGEAQTTIAAQDIADQIQSMIEKFADIKYKELPALHDSIRNVQGVEAATTFNESVTESLNELTTSLEQAKGDVNNAIATLTGQEVAPGPGDLDLDSLEGDEDDLDLDLDAELDFDADSDEDEADFDLGLEDEDEVDLGRSRR